MNIILWVANQKLAVVRFSSCGFALAQDYEFTIHCTGENLKTPPEYLELSAHLQIASINIHGIISKVTGPDLYNCYAFTLRSPLNKLQYHKHSRIFVDKNITEITSEILNTYYIKHQFQLTNKYPRRDMFVQYSETDFEFLQRNLAYFGIFHAFYAEKLTLTDTLNKLPPWQGKNGNKLWLELATATSTTTTLLSQAVNLHAYNYKTPDLALTATATASPPGKGCQHIYSETCQDQAECIRIARIRGEAIAWHAAITTLTTDHSTLLPGQLLTLCNHPITDYNGKYRVIAVNSTSNKPGAYKNNIQIIPATVPFRSSYKSRIIPGIHTAKIHAPTPNKINLDRQGRYQILFPFTTTPSSYLRLLQPLAGKYYGIHFPLPHNTTILYTFLNGNPNQPILLGTIPSSLYPSPVTNKNPTQNIIRTPAGNELIMDDNKQHPKITIATPELDNRLVLDATPNCNNIAITSKHNPIAINSNKDLSQQSKAADLSMHCKNHQVICDTYKITTAQYDINYQAKHNIIIKAKNNIAISCQNKITYQSGANTMFAANNSWQMQVKNANFTVTGHDIYCRSKNNMSFIATNGSLTLGNKMAKIIIHPQGTIHIMARVINIKTSKYIISSNSCNMQQT